jgi:DNA (cytosine-5)-methyltransferase 1
MKIKNKFITRVHSYAVKLLKSGASRVYILNKEALCNSDLPANTRVRVDYSKHRIVITADENGNHKIMDTGRGELFELKNKATGEALGNVDAITATFRKGKIVLTLRRQDQLKLEREKSFIEALCAGKPLRTGSFFSGLGMLTYHLKKGLESRGIETELAFANDLSPLAMSCNLEGNPIWDDATNDAMAVVDELGQIPLDMIPKMHIAEAGYPCVAQSTLCEPANRDTNHPIVGTLFIDFVAALKQANPAIIIIENAPAFANSQTLDFISREMKGYRLSTANFNAHDFGEIEGRRRACVVLVSEGLPDFDIKQLSAPASPQRPVFGDYLDDIPATSEKFRHFAHLHRKTADKRVNYANAVHHRNETKIGTITASYAAKAGAPFVAHPTDPMLQRFIETHEHARIRKVPEKLFSLMSDIAEGRHQLVSKKGSKSAVHRLLGNGVSEKVWQSIGAFLGRYINTIMPQQSLEFAEQKAA